MMDAKHDTSIAALGPAGHRSPLNLSTTFGDGIGNFMLEEARVRYQVAFNTGLDAPDLLFEAAGPREQIFFKPDETRAAIVTCGGLCPGINCVIRSVTLELFLNYGVKDVLGIQYGYQGLNPALAAEPVRLTPDLVEDIHREGGTMLGSSRGAQDIGTMVDYLESAGINILFCIGGDGTQKGTHAIAQEVLRRKKPIAVVGIPKTIDNDILYVQRTFGYTTAIDEARRVLDCAHVEAKGAINGIGLVRVMGRDSGFIACGATLASQEPNYTLIPEVPLVLDGEKGFLRHLHERMKARAHAVIVVAEGAGQDLLAADERRDPSGNRIHSDIGVYLKSRIKEYFAGAGFPVSVKYIDPSYIIRSVPANSEDSFLCDQYARNAVHAGMAGKTDVLIGSWNNAFLHVPIEMAVAKRHRVQTEGNFWNSVIAATGQPRVWE